MADSYICPTCDHEVVVGQICSVCTQTKKRKVKKKTVNKPWEQDEIYDDLDLPDDDFDYDDFIEREFGTSDQPSHKKIGISWYWWLTAMLLCILWIITMI